MLIPTMTTIMINNKLNNITTNNKIRHNADFVEAKHAVATVVLDKHQSTFPSSPKRQQEGRRGGQRKNMKGSVLNAPKRDKKTIQNIHAYRKQLLQRMVSKRTTPRSNKSNCSCEEQQIATTNNPVGTTTSCSATTTTTSPSRSDYFQEDELSMLRRKQELLHSLLPQEIADNIHHHWSPPSPRVQEGRGSLQGTNEEQQSYQGGDHGECISFSPPKRASATRSSLPCDSSIPSSIVLQANNADPTTNMLEVSNHTAASEGVVSAISSSSSSALYSEDVSDVSMVFVDIVGFSRISQEIPASNVMDMLQDLFHRFDDVCERHDILKLDTIGDSYLCSAGGLSSCNNYDDKHSNRQQDQENECNDEKLSQQDQDGGLSHALRALAAAKDMVREARKVPVPRSLTGDDDKEEYLSVRVGIHVGDATFGVLGLSLPKLVCLGNTVNMAARMEQTCMPNMIHVTEAFHDLIGDDETEWECKEKVLIKNMGEVNAYLLDPFKEKSESCWV